MKKVEIKRNGLILWYRTYRGGKMAYALQYEPSEGLMDQNDPTTAPVYIARDGFEEEDLLEVLDERDRLREREKKLKEWETRLADANTDKLLRLESELESLKRTLWDTKKWYQFWK